MRGHVISQNSSGCYTSKKLEDHWIPVQDHTCWGIHHGKNQEDRKTMSTFLLLGCREMKLQQRNGYTACCSVAQLCLTLCHPMDCGPPGSSLHGDPQARILEWIVTSFSRGSSQPRDRTYISCTGRQILYHWAPWEARCHYNLIDIQSEKVALCSPAYHGAGPGTWRGEEATGQALS